jgi:hypothetical protein
MQAGKTIAAKREKVAPDSERERARKTIRKRKVLSVIAVIALAGLLIYLGVRAFTEWIKWISTKEEAVVLERTPSVEIIDDTTGKAAEKVSSRVKELVVNLEEEFVLIEHKITRVHIPQDKIRELDLEIEGFSGLMKISTDRNAAVTAEDAGRMIKYLEGQGINAVEYVDIRLERKAYWK